MSEDNQDKVEKFFSKNFEKIILFCLVLFCLWQGAENNAAQRAIEQLNQRVSDLYVANDAEALSDYLKATYGESPLLERIDNEHYKIILKNGKSKIFNRTQLLVDSINWSIKNKKSK